MVCEPQKVVIEMFYFKKMQQFFSRASVSLQDSMEELELLRQCVW